LRRPLSVHGAQAGKVEMLYEVVGPATLALSRRSPGQDLDVLGPLGRGFDYRAGRAASPVLVAGGMGVAPLVFLAQKMKEEKLRGSRGKITVLLGAGSAKQVLCEKEFKKLGCAVKIATDDGSRGFHGRVTELLNSLFPTMNCQLSTIYSCGPGPMLDQIIRISREKHVPAQVSLETHMACGIGACLGCVVNTRSGYKRVCKDGPVFNAEEF